MAWCEKHAVDYVFGFARNPRLRRKIAQEMRQAKKEQQGTGEPARVFSEFFYRKLPRLLSAVFVFCMIPIAGRIG